MELRDRLPMQDVARFYGLEMDRAGFAVCPFHPDDDPSLKVYDDHYHCFGCGAHGDVTDFTARLFGLSQYQAAKKLDCDLGLNLLTYSRKESIPRKVNPEVAYRNWLNSARRTLNEYLNLLYRWRSQYAPRHPDERQHPLFVESLTKMNYYEYLYDVLRYGSESEKRDCYENDREKIRKLAELIKQQAFVKSAMSRHIV